MSRRVEPPLPWWRDGHRIGAALLCAFPAVAVLLQAERWGWALVALACFFAVMPAADFLTTPRRRPSLDDPGCETPDDWGNR